MSELYSYNKEQRWLNGGVNVFYKTVSGFVLGAGIAGLLPILGTPLLISILVFGLTFALSWAFKEAFTAYKRNKLEEFLAKEGQKLEEERANLNDDFQYGPDPIKYPKMSRLFHYLYFGNKQFLKAMNIIFNVISIVSILGVFNLSITALPVLSSIGFVLGLSTYLISSVACYLFTLALKARIRNIHRHIEFFHDNQKVELFKQEAFDKAFAPLTKQEAFIYGYALPAFSGFVAALTSAGTIFGILILFGIGMSLALPVFSPAVLLGISLIVGVTVGLMTAKKMIQENRVKLEYIDNVNKKYQQNIYKGVDPRSNIISLSEYKAQEATSKKEKAASLHAEIKHGAAKFADSAVDVLESLWQFFDGAGIGTGLMIAVITGLSMVGIMMPNPISITLIIGVGLLFAALNYYRLNYTKDEQRKHSYDMINDLRKQTKDEENTLERSLQHPNTLQHLSRLADYEMSISSEETTSPKTPPNTPVLSKRRAQVDSPINQNAFLVNSRDPKDTFITPPSQHPQAVC